eukprot:sb/3465885/
MRDLAALHRFTPEVPSGLYCIRCFSMHDGLGLSVRVWLGFGLRLSVSDNRQHNSSKRQCCVFSQNFLILSEQQGKELGRESERPAAHLSPLRDYLSRCHATQSVSSALKKRQDKILKGKPTHTHTHTHFNHMAALHRFTPEVPSGLYCIRCFSMHDGLGLSVRVWLGFGLRLSVSEQQGKELGRESERPAAHLSPLRDYLSRCHATQSVSSALKKRQDKILKGKPTHTHTHTHFNHILELWVTFRREAKGDPYTVTGCGNAPPLNQPLYTNCMIEEFSVMGGGKGNYFRLPIVVICDERGELSCLREMSSAFFVVCVCSMYWKCGLRSQWPLSEQIAVEKPYSSRGLSTRYLKLFFNRIISIFQEF